MLRQEVKKFFLKRYFLIVLVVVLLAEGVMCISQSRNTFNSYFDKETYEHYINAYGGSLTEEKKEMIELNLAGLYDETVLKDGTLPKAQLQQVETMMAASVRGRLGVEQFREAYDYAAAKDGRDIIHVNAWNYLFGTERMDFFCILAVILFTVLTFVAENETNITLMKYATPKGKKQLYRMDLLSGILFAALLSLAVSALRFGVGVAQFSVHDFTAPLESLPLFENTRYSVTLLGGYLLIAGIKAAGLAAFTALCFLFGNLFASSVTVVMGSLLAVLLPQYVLNAPFIYYIPPVSLLLGNGLFFGTVELEIENNLPLVVSVSSGVAALPLSLLGASLLLGSAVCMTRKRRGTQ